VIGSELFGTEQLGQEPAVGNPRKEHSIWKLIRRHRSLSVHAGALPHLIWNRRQMRLRKWGVVPPDTIDHQPFMNCQLARTEPDAHRIAYAGELTPRGGVAEFLSTAIAWADANPVVLVEIIWLGEGDLLGVLQAQPAPANLRQTFASIPTCDVLATLFGRCGIFVIPSLSNLQFNWITAAMAAGLPVLGSVHDNYVRAAVVQNKNGWLFDPFREEEMSTALNTALTATPAQLNEMREAAREQSKLMLRELPQESVNRRNVDNHQVETQSSMWLSRSY